MTATTSGDHRAETGHEAPTEHTTLAERLSAMTARLAELRDQTEALSERARDATARGAEARAGVSGCNHAAQVEQMRQALSAVEDELDGVRAAMQTRGVIEQAKGMLMLHRRCGADEAFAMLVELSQNSHHKLVEVAQTLVTSWSATDASP